MIAGSIGLGVQWIFIGIALLLFLAGNSRGGPVAAGIGELSINFTSLVLEALPFMLIGSLAGGIIEVFIVFDRFNRFLGSRPVGAVLLAGGLGLFLPTCECAIVPIVRRLLLKGVPIPAAITFMLAGPIVNVIVGWSTAVAYVFDWQAVFWRLGSGYLVAITAGLLFAFVFSTDNALRADLQQTSSRRCGCAHLDYRLLSWKEKIRHLLNHAAADFLEVGKYLIIGAFIAALLRSVVPVSVFNELMESPWLAILLMMIMAMLLNLCSEADAFIAASFRWMLPGSAQLGFLVLGPMLDVKLMLMYLTVFRKRMILKLSLTVFALVYGAMLLLEWLASPQFF